MINYSVRYKEKGFLKRWKILKNVEGDGLLETGTHRFFVLPDKSRIEIPIIGTIFIFDSMRFTAIKDNKENEIGQNIKTK